MAYGVLLNHVEIANTEENEVFPSTSEDLDLFFSRASKNYGLQLYKHGAGDSTPVAMALNNRGDDFGLGLAQRQHSPIFAEQAPWQSLRIFNSTVYPFLRHHRRSIRPHLAAQALEDSLTIAALKADSIAAFNLANVSENTAPSAKGTKWVTDNTPEPGTTSGYSLIVGGFVDRDLAEGFLESIVGWAPEAFLSRYNEKYYVVHSIHNYRDDANAAKASVNNRDYRAWVLSKGLKSL